MLIATAQSEFAAEGVYLNTASLGLPPRVCLEALDEAVEDWRLGRASPPDYDGAVGASRDTYARLVGVDAEDVAIGSQVSVFAGLVAASLPSGSEVLTAEGDFTSILFPFFAQRRRGVAVRVAPLELLPEAVRPSTTLVAVSAVQSADGRVAPLDALVEACAATGTRVLLDTTQAVGWLGIDAGRFAYTVGGGYKWLLAPRGTAFFTIRRELRDELVPHAAGWYAGPEPWSSIYGAPLRLADDARRFDISPVWHSWVGQAPALDLLAAVGVRALNAHALGLANRFRGSLGMPPGDSAIVAVRGDDQVPQRLASAGIAASFRVGRVRLSFHINNTEQDADRAAEALAGCVE
jgi:selenocysteine lyase/cysteine desulfurase